MTAIEYDGETYQYDENSLELYRADGSRVENAMEAIHIVTEWETIQSMENPNVQREAEKIIATGRQLLDDMPGAPTAK